VPFGLICFSVVTLWYALHGHAPDDVTSRSPRLRLRAFACVGVALGLRAGVSLLLMRAIVRPPVDGGTVLVTGASAGIGRALSVQLGVRAATLVVVARRAGRLEELRAELTVRHPRLQVIVEPADLSDEADLERFVAAVYERVGVVDVLVNNAGVGDAALFDQALWSRTRQVLATGVLALARLSAAWVPGMVARGRGGVLNIGSGAGLSVLPAAAAYTGSKHFVDGFTEALRADLAGTGVVVTQVCPGPVDSEFDAAAGSGGGMRGGPPQFLRIDAERCAREALAGFDRGAPLVFPGRAYRQLMHLLPLLPRRVQRRQAARGAAGLRASTLVATLRDEQDGTGAAGDSGAAVGRTST
jgi:uncharacterized protein